jgi:hypothetical protein
MEPHRILGLFPIDVKAIASVRLNRVTIRPAIFSHANESPHQLLPVTRSLMPGR